MGAAGNKRREPRLDLRGSRSPLSSPEERRGKGRDRPEPARSSVEHPVPVREYGDNTTKHIEGGQRTRASRFWSESERSRVEQKREEDDRARAPVDDVRDPFVFSPLALAGGVGLSLTHRLSYPRAEGRPDSPTMTVFLSMAWCEPTMLGMDPVVDMAMNWSTSRIWSVMEMAGDGERSVGKTTAAAGSRREWRRDDINDWALLGRGGRGGEEEARMEVKGRAGWHARRKGEALGSRMLSSSGGRAGLEDVRVAVRVSRRRDGRWVGNACASKLAVGWGGGGEVEKRERRAEGRGRFGLATAEESES